MTGYVRQSAADIVPTAVVRSAPVNSEFNAIRDAFSTSTGHRHDGSTAEGSYVPLIADADANNKVVINTANNRVEFYSEVSAAPAAQVYIQDGVILPVVDNDVDLGSSSFEFKNLFIDGIAKIDTLTVDENATVAGTLNVTGLSTLASVAASGGTINSTVIGGTTPQAITGTLVTATSGFSGTLTGNVTGNLTGNSAGTHTGSVIGDVTGNITASSGSSSFNDVTINGSLNMNSGSAGTVTGLSAPVNGTDATTKTYVDAADALKLNLSGGTMSGAIAMGTNKITGLGTPTSTADAATKGYVDTTVANLIDSAPGTLDTLNELAAALGDDPNFAATTAASIATKVSKAGDTMTGDLVMGSNKVTSTATPATDDTLTRKGYVDTQVGTRLPLAGGTMSGAIAMGTSKITGMGDPTSNQDAATKVYVDTADALKLNLSGGTMTGNITMGANKVTSTATPTADDDLTRKGYVDSILGSATSAAASAAAAATSETNAAGSASAAATSASNAAASFDSFDDRYLGAKASAPSVDNDGNALLTGAIYWNTSSDSLFIWTGSVWNAAAFDTSGALIAVNNLSDVQDAATARANLGISDLVVLSNKTSAYTVTTDDIGKIINATGDGTFTVTIPGASTAGAGFNVKIWNTGDGTITISGGGVIDGGSLTSRVLYAWEGVELVSDGTNWYSGSTKSTRYYAENGNDGNTTRPIASGLYSIALGGASTASGVGSLAVGLSTTASGTSSNAFGRSSANAGAVAAGNGSVALNGSHAGGADSVAAGIGTNNVTYGATGSNSIAMGQLAKATNLSGTAIGTNAIASADYSTALGYGSNATGSGAVALGASTASGQAALASVGANASGFYSVALGESSAASGTNSIAIGNAAKSNIVSKFAFAGGPFSTSGDAQTGTFILRSDTTAATPEALTTNNGAASTDNQIILPNNSAYAFHGTIVARQQASAGTDCAAWRIEGLIRREGSAGTTVLVNSATTVLDNTPGWGMALSADTTNGGLKIEVTGAAATNIRWVATVHTSEVTY